MTLKTIYYRIRPMAEDKSTRPYNIHPIVYFAGSSCFSLVGGFIGGVELWFNAGFTPENSGGTMIFILGAIPISIISIVVYFIQKNRWVFYGLNTFTLIALLLLLLSIKWT